MFYCELLSGLWIGDTDILNNEKFIKDNNISIILNCTQMFEFPKIEEIKKVRLPFSPIRESDKDIYLLRENYKKVVDYISDNLDISRLKEVTDKDILRINKYKKALAKLKL